MKKRYLVLDDGTVFEGLAFGADVSSTGELVFTTGMSGYIETLTDPSYYGQIVVQTFPLIGNYGVIEADFEGICHVRGYVVRDWCRYPSNFRCQYDIDEFLRKNGVAGIYAVDTRCIVKQIRERGVMNAVLCDSVPDDLTVIKHYRISDAVENVTVAEPEVYAADGHCRYRVALMDFGAKRSIISELCRRGCEVVRLPAHTTAEQIMGMSVDGVMLSNGPGDPAENTAIVEQIGELFGKVPIFGICLGHQLLALSRGAKTVKLKYGHRGVNQPVRDLLGSRTYITSQNHGYAVAADSTVKGTLSFINANDFTCEGLEYPGEHAFSVQFHPEASAGPRDTSFLFDKFCGLMDGD